MSSNLRVVSTNIALAATTLTASTEAGTLVVENMLLDSKTEIWRSTGTTETVTAIFAQQNTNCVTFPICNFTSSATMRVRVYTLSGDGSPALDTGNTLCCEYTTIDKIDFGNGSLNANTFSYGGGTYATLYYTETLGEKVVIDIIDASNTNGYIEASFLVIGTYWSPVINALYGAELLFSDTSKHSRNDSGDLMTNRGARYRSIRFSLDYMQDLDRTALMEIFIRNGLSVPLYLSLLPDSVNSQEKQMYQIYGRINKMGAFNRYSFGADKGSIEVLEI